MKTAKEIAEKTWVNVLAMKCSGLKSTNNRKEMNSINNTNLNDSNC